MKKEKKLQITLRACVTSSLAYSELYAWIIMLICLPWMGVLDLRDKILDGGYEVN